MVYSTLHPLDADARRTACHVGPLDGIPYGPALEGPL